MRNLISIIAIASLAATAACVPLDNNSQIQQALPTADSVSIDVPESSEKALGEVAEFYGFTRGISQELNGGAGWVLTLVHAIVQYPATSVEGNVYTWGPHSDALDPAEWRLTVVENEDGTYEWAIDGRSKLDDQADFLTLMAGQATPGEDPHRGTGTFMVDFDAAKQIDPLNDDDATGQLVVAYDLENRDGSPSTIEMALDTTEIDANGVEQPVYFEYGYAENLDSSGALVFGIHGDLGENGQIEDALIHSRWQVDGQGRADIAITGGEIGDQVVLASECWDTSFRRVYYADSANFAAAEGEQASCAFAEAVYPEDN